MYRQEAVFRTSRCSAHAQVVKEFNALAGQGPWMVVLNSNFWDLGTYSKRNASILAGDTYHCPLLLAMPDFVKHKDRLFDGDSSAGQHSSSDWASRSTNFMIV